MIIIVLITTTTDSSLDSKMYIISILYNIINCHARVFYEKKKRKKRTNEPRPSEHPPVVGGKNKHRIHGKLGIQLSF